MMLQRSTSRAAFTMVEMMVVIVIIAVLMTLLVATISGVLRRVDNTRTIAEINELAQGLEHFKLEYGRYPPSYVILKEQADYITSVNMSGQPNNPDEYYSYIILQAIFGSNFDPNADHDWDGNGQIQNVSYTLEGHQCLVYFLGGPQGTGFAAQKARPCDLLVAGTQRPRVGPFFTFNLARIRSSNGQGSAANFGSQGTPSTFPAYYCVFGRPYLYFRGTDAAYDNYFPDNCRTVTQSFGNNATLPSRFRPYWESRTGTQYRYMRPDKFQIISAGHDQLYGSGEQYRATDPQTGTSITGQDFDNLTNFTEGRIVP